MNSLRMLYSTCEGAKRAGVVGPLAGAVPRVGSPVSSGKVAAEAGKVLSGAPLP